MNGAPPPAPAPAVPPAAQASQNKVFEELVLKDEDKKIIGMIAYSLYKQSKREWIIENNPTTDEQAKYYRHVTPNQIELYRSRAESMLVEFAKTAIENSADAYKREGADSAIVAEVKRQQNFFVNLFVNVLGSLVFSLLLVAFWFAFVAPSIVDFMRRIPGVSEVK